MKTSLDNGQATWRRKFYEPREKARTKGEREDRRTEGRVEGTSTRVRQGVHLFARHVSALPFSAICLKSTLEHNEYFAKLKCCCSSVPS